ncbi:OmpH family outer membrane protein [Granulicella sp. S156]|jgi:Skp family chaperone for outer membrane proteins|uniref:OmpH family outer membrane protein n=1 Tax=Granulicella sp. S156 TaxID=1747224 RepID=UPI00131CBD76|nr:OmpH family outer membrane protein [Granulicella sp. S156]
MNRTLVFATALAAGLATTNLIAQAPAAAAAPAAAVAPQAIPAKVAIVAFEQAVVATNEGQRSVAEVQKKYEPKKSQIESQGAEVDSLKKQLQALPASAPDDQRASLIKNIDTKDKALQRDAEDAQNAYQSDLQEAYGKVAQKVGATAVKYAQDNGFTLMLNVGGQQQANPVLWFAQTTDITQAVINAYNTSSGVTAPPPSAPAPVHHTTPATHSTTPKQ